MMDYTDRHFRYFLRLISQNALLYTEMITSHALIHGDRDYLLQYHPAEHPIALQLGGSDPAMLAECCRIAEDYGYDEINLNVGCPSDRVQAGRFGLCLMKEPELVAECIDKMQQATRIPITVKTRLGVDDLDNDPYLHQFIETIHQTGCNTFIIHARKGWLKGLNPKQNRTIPPLQYQRVYVLKQHFPKLTIIINGGIESIESMQMHLKQVDGAMLGRAAYQNPYLLASVDQCFYQSTQTAPSRQDILNSLTEYVAAQCQQGVKLHHITRHLHGLYFGQPNAKKWRQQLTTLSQIESDSLTAWQQSLRRLNFT